MGNVISSFLILLFSLICPVILVVMYQYAKQEIHELEKLRDKGKSGYMRRVNRFRMRGRSIPLPMILIERNIEQENLENKYETNILLDLGKHNLRFQ